MKHLACIMDGNRRWAKQHFAAAITGHQKGMEKISQVIDFCLEKRISYLSLYTLSLENVRERSQAELSTLFRLFEEVWERILQESLQKNVRICFIGDRAAFPPSLVAPIERLERDTAHNGMLRVNILFCYGARQEIVHGIKLLFDKIKNGLLNKDDICHELFIQQLWTNGTPEPDIIIRTGGVRRLSNFMLYQAAYSEVYFLDCFWPEITHDHLQEVWDFFGSCKRNFGK